MMGAIAMSEAERDLYGDDFAGLSDGSTNDTSLAKRKRQEDDEDTKTECKRAAKKRKQKKKAFAGDDESLDTTLGVNHAIAHMDSRLMADHIAQRTKRFRPDASVVELEDTHVPASAIVETSSWSSQRTSDNLPDFLEHFAGPRRQKKGQKLSDAPKEKGRPHTLVVTSAGQRAADLARDLKKFRTKDAMVAKLFAKHIKLKEAVEAARKTRMGIGVGTPQRLIDLLEDGALSVSKLERIVVDASHIDQKKRGILDMRETQTPLVLLLARPELKERYGSSSADRVDLLLF